MKTKYLFQCLLIILCLGFTACQEDDSPTEGPKGEQGLPGEDGEDGEDGNANVIISDWEYGSARRDTVIDGSNMNYVKVIAPELSATYLNNSAILVYMTFGPIIPLPYTSYAGGKVSTINFIPSANKLFITRFTHDNSGSIQLSSGLLYRYVIIPSQEDLRINFEAMSYEEVMDYFGKSY